MNNRIDFEAWLKANMPADCVNIVKGELMTFVRLWGLAYLSEALAAFKSSWQRDELRDMQFKGDRLIIAYAHNTDS